MIVAGRDMVHGFDWSIYQPVRDHHNDGQSFAVIKATEGNGYRDPKYRDHVASLDAVGMVHGAYHFAQPTGPDAYQDGQAEARFILSLLASTERFIVLDLESTHVSAHDTALYVRGWLDVVLADGRFPMRDQRVLYVGKWFGWEHTGSVARDAVLWIPAYTAGYTPNVNPALIPPPAWSNDLWPEGWSIWQYSSSGTVAGVHPSDVNVATTSWFAAVSGGLPFPVQPFVPAQPHGEDMIAVNYEGAVYTLHTEKATNAKWWSHEGSADEIAAERLTVIAIPDSNYPELGHMWERYEVVGYGARGPLVAA